MKSIRNFILKYSNKFYGFILLILGFSLACSEGACEYGSPAAEYGTPYATFIVKGKVRNDATSQEITSIRVIMNEDTSYTDINGNYKVENIAFPSDQAFAIRFEDANGVKNGLYESLDTTVDFIDPQFTGGNDDWYEGETEQEFQVRMKLNN